MKTNQRLIVVLAAMFLLAVWGLYCGGDKVGSGAFEAGTPIWGDKNPGAAKTLDFCHDGVDNNGDRLADEHGVPPGCSGDNCIYEPDPHCQLPLSTGEAECSDNLDNDRALDILAYGATVPILIDKADPGCVLCGLWFPQYSSESDFDLGNPSPECCDGIDNDCDGKFDSADDLCYGYNIFWEGPLVSKQCNDGIDNDGDGLIDLADPNCHGDMCWDNEGTVVTVQHVVSGANGICESTAVPDDVQVIPVGQGAPNSLCVTDGNGDNSMAAPIGDDGLTPPGCTNGVNCTGILSGANGICNTAAAAGDTQNIALGKGQANAICVSPGADQTLQTGVGGDDVIQ